VTRAVADTPWRIVLPQPAGSAEAPGEPLFEGTLPELAHALRNRRLAPRSVDLLVVVREVLRRFEALAADDLDLASESLPMAAAVVELKARLLLPQRGGGVAEEELENEERGEALAAIALLQELEAAIEALRQRREERRYHLPASAPSPTYPRRPRPLGIPLARLTEIAARLRPTGYFELVRDRLSVALAIRRILARLRPGVREPLEGLVEEPGWGSRTIYFAGALELVRDGRAHLHQGEDFGPIEVEGAGGD
jgi:segregation and condensation protein A